MAISVTANFQGDSIYNTTDLVIKVIEDAVYIPFSPYVFFDRDPDWGIYTSGGAIFNEATYRRGPKQALIGQSEFRDVRTIKIEDCSFDEMVYGGPIIPHYGHFLISSLARIWAINGKTPTLFHSSPPVFQHERKYVRDLLEYAQLNTGNAVSFSCPTRIKRLFVPQLALLEQFYVSPVYFESVREIGKKIAPSDFLSGAKCYLTKSRLPLGVSKIEQEEVIERAFEGRGFQIIYPEQFTISQQVNMLRNAKVVVGTSGSAFHTAVLSSDARALRIIFSCDGYINSNFKLLDYGIASDVHYLSIADEVGPCTSESFASGWLAKNISDLAEKMAEAVMELIP